MTAHIQDLIAIRRRQFLLGAAALPLLTLDADAQPRPLGFTSVPANTDDRVTVPPGYSVQTLISWRDALFENMPATIDADALTRAEQELRFGQNNDMLALFPLRYAYPQSRTQNRYLLCVNHEYADQGLSFPAARSQAEFNEQRQAAMYAGLGVTVVQVERRRGQWRVVRDAQPGAGFNRRISAFAPVIFDGPAAQHRWVVAGAASVNAFEPGAPVGTVPCGTLSNCAGGVTPWGTYLTSEENFNFSYGFTQANAPARAGVSEDAAWTRDCQSFATPTAPTEFNRTVPPQYDVSRNPYGPSLYGWTVEIDPYDPNWTPRKRTALGRRKGECANTALTRDNRIAVYSGDDQANEFVYKFISTGHFNPRNRTANRDLLSEGTLHVAQFHADGSGAWLPLTVETANAARASRADVPAFTDLGDVLVRAREAARLMGATPMDRPEDVEAIVDHRHVGQGPVLIACTNNRTAHTGIPGNPRREGPEPSQANAAGHIVRIDEDGGDCGATSFHWDVFALGGDPNATEPVARIQNGTSANISVALNGAPTTSGDRFACPDNICFDAQQNVWIATDDSTNIFDDCNDAVLVAPTAGSGPRPLKRFLTGPVGCEICGPTITPDQRAFLVSIQHPGETDRAGAQWARTRFSTPSARPPSSFPDGGEAWPRASVVVITKNDGGIVGS